MEIIEQSLTPKSPKTKTEDGVVVTADYVAVIDGSTSKSPTRVSRWRSNGRYCMQLVERYLRHARRDLTAEQFCRGVTAYVASKFRGKRERLFLHPEERLTASCAVFSRLHRQIWMIGDCHCLVGDAYYDNPKPTEAVIAGHRAEIIKRLLAEEKATEEGLLQHDIAREELLPELIAATKGQNVDYSVVDGFAIPMDKVRIVSLDFSPWTVVLATDGYPFLRPTLEESEAALARQRAIDPLNIGDFRATKAFMEGNNSFDDRAYVRFRV